jgi:hypothetical protein
MRREHDFSPRLAPAVPLPFPDGDQVPKFVCVYLVRIGFRNFGNYFRNRLFLPGRAECRRQFLLSFDYI